MSLTRKLKLKTWFFLQRNRRNPIVARVAKLCKNIHRATEHPSDDCSVNGERDIIARFAGSDSAIHFDVGANRGDWTALALELNPKSRLFLFEINPPVAAEVAARFAANPAVQVFPFGLSDNEATVEVTAFTGDNSALTAIGRTTWSVLPYTVIQAPVKKGDDVCQAAGVNQIDILKVDAEGAEFQILQGFTRMLQGKKIRCIQFENYARTLRDFHEILRPCGYVIGKLYANYVDFREYDRSVDEFLGPNYIAIPETETALIAELKKGW